MLDRTEPTHIRPRLAHVLVLGVLAGCSQNDTSSNALAPWTLVPDVRIGSVDTPDYTFGHITGLSIGPDEEIYVTQWQDPTIAVYDRDGRYLRALGGEGGGPGEFAMPDLMGWLGDTIWVHDPMLGRISLLGRDGNLLATVKFFIEIDDPRSDLLMIDVRPSAMLADGTVLATSGVFTNVAARGEHPLVPTLRATREGQVLDTVAVEDVNEAYLMIQYGDDRFTVGRDPFAVRRLVSSGPSGIELVMVQQQAGAGGGPSSFGITALTAHGDTIFDRRYRYEPIATPNNMAEIVAAADNPDWIEDAVERNRHLRNYLAALEPPEFLTPVSSLLVGRDGTIWLRREDTWQDSIRWEVLDAAGEPLAELDLPRALRIMQAQRDAVWAIEQDELDVSYIVRFGVQDAVD